MLRTLKNYVRRRRLTSRGIVPEIRISTWTAGARSGMWTIATESLAADGVVLSFGVGDNLAWELALIERFGVAVHAFDPTPASVAWAAKQQLPAGLRFHAIGLAGHDGELTFTLPARGSRFNFRPQDSGDSAVGGVKAPVRRLSTHLEHLGLDRVEILKLDIEGGEYASLDEVYSGRIAPRQLLLEFHHHFPGVGIPRTEEAVAKLRAAGYRIFHMSPRGLEMSFLRDER
ncbi:MAG: FkbM family methyltransferase [Planctomycetaceae bacterium]|nr:FkbM family methyltransferase [Planctomycetaceae bacterium]